MSGGAGRPHLLPADWLICASVSRMILKSDGIIPPPPAAPAPQPPAPSNQVEGKNPRAVSVLLTSVVSISVVFSIDAVFQRNISSPQKKEEPR